VHDREKSRRLDAGEIEQIAGFGQNPMRLFDDPHKPFKEKCRRSLMDYDEVDVHCKCHSEFQNNEVFMIRILTNKKNILCTISDNELYKLTTNPIKCKTKLKLHSFYPILSKNIFTADPRSAFAYDKNYLVTCRHPNRSFVIYNLNTFTRVQSIIFHLVVSFIIVEFSDSCESM